MNVNPNRAHGEQPPVAPTRSRATEAERAAGAAPAAPAAGSLQLSAQAQEFLRLRPRLEALPPVSRDERVGQLKTLIERGAYRVDGARIADAMLKDRALARTLGLEPGQ